MAGNNAAFSPVVSMLEKDFPAIPSIVVKGLNTDFKPVFIAPVTDSAILLNVS